MFVPKFSLWISLAVFFPLISKPFSIMHKRSIMNYGFQIKECLKEKGNIYLFLNKKGSNIQITKNKRRNKHIQTNEHMGPLIKLISRCISKWAIGKHPESSEQMPWSKLFPLDRNYHSFVEILHWFNFGRAALSSFQLMPFSSLIMPFSSFFLHLFLSISLFQYHLRTWNLFKMNEKLKR